MLGISAQAEPRLERPRRIVGVARTVQAQEGLLQLAGDVVEQLAIGLAVARLDKRHLARNAAIDAFRRDRNRTRWEKLADDEHPVEAAAERAGVSQGTMRVRIHRGYRALRALLLGKDG